MMISILWLIKYENTCKDIKFKKINSFYLKRKITKLSIFPENDMASKLHHRHVIEQYSFIYHQTATSTVPMITHAGATYTNEMAQVGDSKDYQEPTSVKFKYNFLSRKKVVSKKVSIFFMSLHVDIDNCCEHTHRNITATGTWTIYRQMEKPATKHLSTACIGSQQKCQQVTSTPS